MVVNIGKYLKYDGCDKQSTGGYINTKLVLELRSGLITDSIEDDKGCFGP